MSSTKPYLLRAIHEWAEDNQFTPQVLVNASVVGVEVPMNHVIDDQIVLNIGTGAVQMHVMDNDCLNFSARFSGKEHTIFLPMESIIAIFARENSQGIFFEEAGTNDPQDPIEGSRTDSTGSNEKGGKPGNGQSNTKRDTSHLKIIK